MNFFLETTHTSAFTWFLFSWNALKLKLMKIKLETVFYIKWTGQISCQFVLFGQILIHFSPWEIGRDRRNSMKWRVSCFGYMFGPHFDKIILLSAPGVIAEGSSFHSRFSWVILLTSFRLSNSVRGGKAQWGQLYVRCQPMKGRTDDNTGGMPLHFCVGSLTFHRDCEHRRVVGCGLWFVVLVLGDLKVWPFSDDISRVANSTQLYPEC